jgi:hypothetical protein
MGASRDLLTELFPYLESTFIQYSATSGSITYMYGVLYDLNWSQTIIIIVTS